MNTHRLLGVALLCVGLFLLCFGLGATNTIGETITEGITGHYTDKTTWYIVGGSVVAVVGGLLAFFGRGRTSVA